MRTVLNLLFLVLIDRSLASALIFLGILRKSKEMKSENGLPRMIPVRNNLNYNEFQNSRKNSNIFKYYYKINISKIAIAVSSFCF